MEGKAHEGNAGCSFPMQKMAEAEDVEAYFSAFEHTAMIEERPKEQWAALLLPLLTGEALAAYKDLQADAKQDYEKLKTEILNCLGIKSSVNDECTMDDWSYQWEKPPHSQIYSLIHLTRKWLKPDSSSVSQVVDRLVLHQFQKALPTTVKSSIHQIDPKNVKELIALLEKEPLRYNVALKADKPNIPGKPF
ncbi:neurotrophin receptor-interacting factor 1-like [Xenopus laevis]|uniref:Neurotrophin receptor-interacting factor 1-like n=1 Tax=Xenopus laevis TaxID=8355 RepID=A0A8J0VKK3_XENLA|nr:neurotrophin receptor-interacting factor 1-like [Xenopus laevis]